MTASGGGGVDADDLAMLAASFEAAMRSSTGPDQMDAALVDLGWAEVLSAEPTRGTALAFAALGATGATGGLLDDVITQALGLEASVDRCVVLPAPGNAIPPGRRVDDKFVVDGIVSARARSASTMLVPLVEERDGRAIRLVELGSELRHAPTAATLDPGGSYRRVRFTIPVLAAEEIQPTVVWGSAVAAARVALAHQLIAAARVMLDQARRHAIDRVQFGRPVASFQAVRHRLAESLVHLEGAAAVADVWTEDADPLLAALAKSLAGKAALATAGHAQQVLAGIGFTTDHPFQLGLKRVLTIDALFGSANSLPSEIGAELLTRGSAPRLVEL